MIVYKFISDCLDMITAYYRRFDQVTDNPSTSVQPSWWAKDVESSLSLSHFLALAVLHVC